MDIRVLQYFLAVVREENITKAAQLLHITQPTLSRQLIGLEQELGVKLFSRNNHSVTLTEEGMLFRRRAEEIVTLSEMTKRELKQEAMLTGEICTPMEPFSDQQGGFISEGYEMSDKDRSTRGFVFESSAVENEIQKVMNIWNDQNNLDTLFSFDKYKKNGYSDWQSYYEKFNADLKNAGIDKIVDEMNHQIAEYAAKKN